MAIFLWQEFRPKKADERPWIVVSHVTSPGGVAVGIPLKVSITLQNASNTPATHVRAAAIAEWLPPGQEPMFVYDRVTISGKSTVGPGTDFFIDLHPTKEANGEIGYLVTEDYEKIISKSIILFAHGQVSYEDISGRSHLTEFCYWLSARQTGEHFWNVFET